ncbi:DUF1707 domain-containing protein [Nonomuraea sp. NPDC050153]|uniref:DUF1707 domain-containing protein n=1 Tax=Nonomuraea sp. NPDC050153 TaxID=3364359 RepID=UPI0037B7BDB2
MTTQQIRVQGLEKPSSPALRASGEDRDRVTELLRTAVADGRLDLVEFDERLEAALTACSVRRDGRWRLSHQLVLRTAAGTPTTTHRRRCASA